MLSILCSTPCSSVEAVCAARCAAGLVTAVQAAHDDLKAQQGAVLVTGGGLALERDSMAAAAANYGMATLGVAKAAQRKLVHIMHESLSSDGIYVAEVTVMGGVSTAARAMVRCETCCLLEGWSAAALWCAALPGPVNHLHDTCGCFNSCMNMNAVILLSSMCLP